MKRLLLLAALMTGATAIGVAAQDSEALAPGTDATEATAGGPFDFATLDLDGSGEITTEDLDARRDQMFAELDTDGDGSVSEAEFVAFAEARAAERARARFADLDADGDGMLSQDVLAMQQRGRGRMGERMIERFDTDGSGGVSEEEFAAMQDRMGERMGRMRGGHGGGHGEGHGGRHGGRH